MVTALSLCISQRADSTSDSGNVKLPHISQLKPMNIYELTKFLKDENLGVA